jgi:hypothetical protein
MLKFLPGLRRTAKALMRFYCFRMCGIKKQNDQAMSKSLKKIAPQAPINEGRYNRVVFNSSGLLAWGEIYCAVLQKIACAKQACLKFEKAVFVHDKEEDLNKNAYLCYMLAGNGDY